MYGETDPAAAAERTAFRRSSTSYTSRPTPRAGPGASQSAAAAEGTCRRWLTSTRCLLAAATYPPGLGGATAPGSTGPCSASWIGWRNYDVSLPHNKIPDALATPAKKMAIPAMPSGEEFKPEATIVNYYGPSDMLGGHVDDMEADWTKPIVSLSLGCKCIFLLGGKMRDEVPQCSCKVVILY